MDAEAPLAHRLFLALMPPPDLARRIGEVRDALGPKGHVTDERLHMTMGLLDDQPELDEAVVAAAARALRSIEATAPLIRLDRIATGHATSRLVPGEKPPALIALQQRLSRAFDDAGLPFAARWSFDPHVTLLYRPAEPRNAPISPIDWRADDLALIDSLVGLRRYVVLERVRLGVARSHS